MADFSNRAYLFKNGKAVASNVVKGTLSPRVTVHKRAVEPHYERYGKVTYIISVSNGTEAVKAVTLSDDLGGSVGASPLSYINGTAAIFIGGERQSIAPDATSPALVFGGIELPAGAVATIVYQARVSFCAGDTITNAVTLTGDGIETPLVAANTITRDKRINGGEPPFTYSVKDI